MALTDNRTQLQDSNAVAEVSTQSTADPQSDTTETGLVIQGGTALQFQVTNAQEYVIYDLDLNGATFSLDLSDSTVYIMIKDNLHATFASLGGQIVLANGTDGGGGAAIGYNVAGADVIGLPYEKKYAAMKLDVSVIVASPGTNNVDYFQYVGTEAGLVQTTVTQVGYGSIHLAKAVGTTPNAWFDGIYYIANSTSSTTGYAATVSGGTSGTPETMADLVGDDITVGAGMFSNPIGSAYYIFAPTQWGAATGDTAFAGTDEQWFYLGDNGGGHSVGATHFPMRLLGGTGTNIFRQTRLSNINTGTRAQFYWNDASFDELSLESTSWVDFGAITCPAQDASKFCNNSTFINCDQMILNGLDMDGCTWNGTTDANGAVLVSTTPADADNQVNSTFVSDGTGHAMYINLNTASLTTYSFSGYTFDGYAYQDGTAGNRIFLIDNALDGDVTINLTDTTAINQSSGTTGAFSYEAAAGYTGTVTITQAVTLTLTGIQTDSEVRIINLDDVTNFNKELAGSNQIHGEVLEAEVADGGSGYTNGTQTLTVVGGTGTAAQIQVNVVGGVVTEVTGIISAGDYTDNPVNPVATTGGGGTGATLRLTIAGEFQYAYDGGLGARVAIIVFHLDYKEVRIEQVLPSVTSSIPIQQTTDRVYRNP